MLSSCYADKLNFIFKKIHPGLLSLILHDSYMLIIASLRITNHRIFIMSIKRLKVNYLLCVIETFAVAH